VDTTRTGSQYGPRTIGNATAIHRPNTTIPISTNQSQNDAFGTNNNNRTPSTSNNKNKTQDEPEIRTNNTWQQVKKKTI
jgi:hypothetical protein